MHLGDYRTPGTQTHELLVMLLDLKPHGPDEIARRLVTTNPTTIVSALRIALDADDADWRLPYAESKRAGDGTLLHYYQLKPRRAAVQVPMFEGLSLERADRVPQCVGS